MNSRFVPLPVAAKLRWLRAAMANTDLPPAAKLVAWGLVEHHNTETGQLNPSADRLAAVCGLTRRGVQKALAALKAAFLIEIDLVRAGARQGANAYRLVVAGANAVHSGAEASSANVVPLQREQTGPNQREPRSPEPLKEPKKEQAAVAAGGQRAAAPSAGEILNRLRSKVAERHGPGAANFVEQLGGLQVADRVLRAVAPTRFVQEWANWNGRLLEAARSLGLPVDDVDLELAARPPASWGAATVTGA